MLLRGVAHNSTLNGRILREAGFSDVFVHPASHDGGASLGAALAAAARGGDVLDRTRIRRCDYGSDLPAESILIRELEKWQEFVQWSISDHPERDAAQMLADGKIIGWVQGRSEFGPRALGNRSILADPRPAENRDRVNRVVKYREGYRPFAPAVIEEAAEHYFDLPDVKTSYEFMSYVVGVKSAARTELQAVTHVDSSARLQVVTRESNSRFYSLIKHFGDIVGTPVVLNTSLNNSSEPMVDSVSDTLQCLMTTGLDAVVIGSAIVTARPFSTAQLQNCGWLLAREVELLTVDKLRGEKEYFLNRSYLHSYPSRQRITASLAHFLSNERASDENEDFSGELFDCWKRRLVELQF